MKDANTFSFSIEVPALLYPSVCEPSTRYGTTRYSVTFAAGALPPEIEAMLYPRKAGKDYRHARSKHPPLLSEREENYFAMSSTFQLADVRNITRDRLLSGVPAKLDLEVSKVLDSISGHSRILLLKGVTVSWHDMKAVYDAHDTPFEKG